MIKAFFFDLDGTLVDTHNANYEAYKRALQDIGVELTFDDFKKSVGHQARTFLRWFAPGLDDEAYQAIAERKAVYYKDLMHLSVLNAHLVAFIEELQTEHTVGLVTTAKKKNAEAVLEHHNLKRLFDFVITAEDVKDSKPSPEGYELALSKAGVAPTEALAFEDSEPGLQAAEAAGIPVICIRRFSL